MLSVSVILPTYNERENLEVLIPRLASVLRGRIFEILVVDDSSPDGTEELVRRMSADIPGLRLILRPRRRGIGAALVHGYDEGRHEALVSLDADLSWSADDVPRLLERLEAGADLVVGARHAAGGGYHTPAPRVWVKYLISALGNRLVRWISGVGVSDVSANFRALRREAWSAIKARDESNFILFEMILAARRAGLRVEQLPVVFSDRVHGRSKLNMAVELPKFALKFARAMLFNAGR